MSCSNCPPDACYNGCVNVISDDCVRYTGADIPALGIQTNDPLSAIENVLITKVVSFLDGTGIDITINPSYYCTLVSQYLPEGTPNLVEVLSALVRAACLTQTEIDAIDAALVEINGPYTLGCLTGVDSSSTTHEVVQAIITKLCDVSADLNQLTLDVPANYVKIADLNSLIQAYLNSIVPGVTQYNSRMIPYTAVEYYGSLSNFDGTGAGISANGFSRIFLCNGLNGTPDKRGRVPVGAISGVPGAPLDSSVNPAISGNPNYTLGGSAGVNQITLNTSQIPAHTHSATATSTSVVDEHGGHLHYTSASGANNTTIDGNTVTANEHADGGNASYRLTQSTSSVASTGKTNIVTTGITVATSTVVTNTYTGSGTAHANIQPVRACYFIMYIP
jgi:microcystin-dependent protein